MTYYRVEFPVTTKPSHPTKRFRTEEQAKKHAKRVLGITDDLDLEWKVSISAVQSTGKAL
jgi:hypothetical protein